MEASLQTPTSSSNSAHTNRPALPTFMDHIQELRGRLFWIAVTFILASAATYPFHDFVISFLVAPLKGQELYYLTPIGGFSFIIKICTYVGAVLTLPAIIYHLYKYLQPAVGHIKKQVVFGYVFFSLLLAIAGIAFAYAVILPAALFFLTGLNLEGVQAMLTIDSYYSFVTTYMIGVAVLFQLPLVLLIINAITPLKPKKLMGYQRFVVLGAFIVAAIISPTPDMTNQALLAVPVIVMYQIGVILVWFRNSMQNKKRNRKSQLRSASTVQSPAPPRTAVIDQNELAWIDDLLIAQPAQIKPKAAAALVAQKPLLQTNAINSVKPAKINTPSRGYAMDMMSRQRSARLVPRPLPTMTRGALMAEQQSAVSASRQPLQRPDGPVRYIDGVSVPMQNISL